MTPFSRPFVYAFNFFSNACVNLNRIFSSGTIDVTLLLAGRGGTPSAVSPASGAIASIQNFPFPILMKNSGPAELTF